MTRVLRNRSFCTTAVLRWTLALDDPLCLREQYFSTAFVTLFHITAGDPWPEDPQLYEENGLVIWKVAIFHMAYEISVGWVILQVRG
jgi:hypothetical protein